MTLIIAVLLISELILIAVTLFILFHVKKIIRRHDASFTDIMQSLMKSVSNQDMMLKTHDVILRQIHPAVLRTEEYVKDHEQKSKERHK